MRFLCLFLLAIGVGTTAAHAQPANIQPAPMHGCGTMAVPTSSTAINSANITLCINAQAFPGAQLVIPLKVKVQGLSPSAVYLCKQGGTCATTGEFLATGESVTVNLNSQNIGTQPPTIIGASGTAIVYLEW
jgi:hypothetical protein